MPSGMSGRTYCHACDVEMSTNHYWLHRQSSTHKRMVEARFPMPASPWAPKANKKILAGNSARPSIASKKRQHVN